MYPALGAIPRGDHAIDCARGRSSRDKQIGNKQSESKSAFTKHEMYTREKLQWDPIDKTSPLDNDKSCNLVGFNEDKNQIVFKNSKKYKEWGYKQRSFGVPS